MSTNNRNNSSEKRDNRYFVSIISLLHINDLMTCYAHLLRKNDQDKADGGGIKNHA